MKKNSTFKRFLAFLLCAAMMVTYMPSSVYTLADAETDGIEVETQAAEETGGTEVATPSEEEGTNEETKPAPAETPSDKEDKEESQAGRDAKSVTSDTEAAPSVEKNDTTEDVTKNQNQNVQETETLTPSPESSGNTDDQKGEESVTADDKKETWTVTYRNGDGAVLDTVKVEKGKAIGELPDIAKYNLERDGFKVSWAVLPEGSTDWSASTDDVELIKDGKKYIVNRDLDIIPYYEEEAAKDEAAEVADDYDNDYNKFVEIAVDTLVGNEVIL